MSEGHISSDHKILEYQLFKNMVQEEVELLTYVSGNNYLMDTEWTQKCGNAEVFHVPYSLPAPLMVL